MIQLSPCEACAKLVLLKASGIQQVKSHDGRHNFSQLGSHLIGAAGRRGGGRLGGGRLGGGRGLLGGGGGGGGGGGSAASGNASGCC